MSIKEYASKSELTTYLMVSISTEVSCCLVFVRVFVIWKSFIRLLDGEEEDVDGGKGGGI